MQFEDLPNDLIGDILSRVSDVDVARNCCLVSQDWLRHSRDRDSMAACFELRGEADPVDWMADDSIGLNGAFLMDASDLSSNSASVKADSLREQLTRRAPKLRSAVLRPSWLPVVSLPRLLAPLAESRNLRHLEVNCWIDGATVEQLPLSLRSLDVTFYAGHDRPADLSNLSRLTGLQELVVRISDKGMSTADSTWIDYIELRIGVQEALRSICAAGAGLRTLTLELPARLPLPLPEELLQLYGLRELRVRHLRRLGHRQTDLLLALPQLETLVLSEVGVIGSGAARLREHTTLQHVYLNGVAESLHTLPRLLTVPQMTTLEVTGFVFPPQDTLVLEGVTRAESRLRVLRLNVAGLDDFFSLDARDLARLPQLHTAELRCNYSRVFRDDGLAKRVHAAALRGGGGWQTKWLVEGLALSFLVQQPHSAKNFLPPRPAGYPRPISISGRVARCAAAA